MTAINKDRARSSLRLLRSGAVTHRLLVWVLLAPVKFYRRWLSPLKRGPSCRYLPTCSAYAIEAVQKRGIVVGIALAVWRVLRCNPFFHAGYDPVPARRCAHPAQEQH